MVFVAIDTPMATDSPPSPNEAAIDAAAVLASMVDRSSADTLRPVTEMTEPAAVSTPSMNAATSTAMRFSLAAPAPLSPAAMTPPEIATEPASTNASRSIWLVAATSSAPAAVMAVSCAYALTSIGSRARLTRRNRSGSA